MGKLNNMKIKNKQNKGQVAIVVLLASAILLTLGISASKQTVTDTKIETDEEFKQKTIDISIESIQRRMRSKLSEIEKQKKILNSQDTNLKNKFLLKEDINILFKIEIGIYIWI